MKEPAGIERDFPLARLTTVRTGGSGEYFARAASEQQLLELLAWAAGGGIVVSVVGSGSNLLVADEGVSGLVLKLDRELASISVEGRRMLCGGGARLPAVAARAARAGLSGIEFGVNIPGTVGGAVRMNANAYGGELGEALEWVQIATASGMQRREPRELGLAYRCSSLLDGEVVVRASLSLTAADPDAVKATLEQMRRRRHEAQPQGIKTFGSTFKNPDRSRETRASGANPRSDRSRETRASGANPRSDRSRETRASGANPRSDRSRETRASGANPRSDRSRETRASGANPRSGQRAGALAEGRSAGLLLADAGCNGLRIGGARFAAKHANFIENTGTATTADVVAVMAEGRRRVRERFGVELEPEVQTLGPVRFPWQAAADSS